jgi:hypothetical protein
MRVLAATWEQRNLGVSCDEVTIDANDDWATVEQSLQALNSEYQVVKLPCEQANLLVRVQELGFRCIEVQTTCFHNGQLPALSALQTRMLQGLSCLSASDTDLSIILAEIGKGMFTTDRVALDPHFGPHQAARRYAGWIDDELANGAVTYAIKYKNKVIGFFLLRELRQRAWAAVVGGIFKDYQQLGFGLFMNYLEVSTVMKLGGSRVYTSYSSNNPPIAAIHFALGYKLARQDYVLIRHCFPATKAIPPARVA